MCALPLSEQDKPAERAQKFHKWVKQVEMEASLFPKYQKLVTWAFAEAAMCACEYPNGSEHPRLEALLTFVTKYDGRMMVELLSVMPTEVKEQIFQDESSDNWHSVDYLLELHWAVLPRAEAEWKNLQDFVLKLLEGLHLLMVELVEQVGKTGICFDGLLACWPAVLLACWPAGLLLDCWPAGLLA